MPENHIAASKVEQQHRTMLILWLAFLMTIVMYMFLTFVIPQQDTASNRMLTIVFSAISVFMVGVYFVVKKKFFARAVEEQQAGLVTTGFIMAMALCEVAALLGLVDFMVARDRYFYLLMAISFVGLALHFPKRQDLEAVNYKRIG